ncbi:MAG: prepilin-type N-terminal cleavage/methylation domain-containing protein [Myxococcota bacterium]|nr:prepilin-type N-terminal cleavage/methylation domain-containing protein [Myxococcota bacterium]
MGRRSRGFTLIEMMIVVVIVGILATLAVAGYRKLVNSSHVSEATNMVQSIRLAQESYRSETQQYADISVSLTSYYPSSTPTGKVLTGWGAACPGSVCKQDWSALPLHVDGPVLFGYVTKAGPANSSPPGITGVGGIPATSATDWFIVGAYCDIDSAGSPLGTSVYGTSWSNQIFVINEGQ